MEILIRNMVCRHCVATVERALRQAGLEVEHVELGRAVVHPDPSMPRDKVLELIDSVLRDNDFERIVDSDDALVERMRHAIIAYARDSTLSRLNLSAYIADSLGVGYDHAAKVFSRLTGRSVSKYLILQKVEYVKELLGDSSLTLAEIADKAGYSSVAHLSRQFKEVTGTTTTQYLSAGAARTGLDKV